MDADTPSNRHDRTSRIPVLFPSTPTSSAASLVCLKRRAYERSETGNQTCMSRRGAHAAVSTVIRDSRLVPCSSETQARPFVYENTPEYPFNSVSPGTRCELSAEIGPKARVTQRHKDLLFEVLNAFIPHFSPTRALNVATPRVRPRELAENCRWILERTRVRPR